MTDPKLPRNAETDTRRMKAALLVVVAIAFAAAPIATPFQGFDPDLFPVPQVKPPIQPAGYAFAIWGPIYVWLLVSAGFGLVRRADEADWDTPRWPLIGSLAVGAIWLAVAQTSPVWATILIWLMLALALVAVFRTPKKDAWLLGAPVALYAGWLTAASWVAVGLLGAGYGIGPGATGWAVLGVLGALAMAALVQRALKGAPIYTGAVIWALVGITVANFGDAWGITALSLSGAVALATLGVLAARS